MRDILASAFFLILTGCASFDGRDLVPGQSSAAEVEAAMGPAAILIYRISLIDLVPDGSTWDEVVQLAKAVEAEGASTLNTGIGWHEARVPTIATSVPRAAFAHLTARLRPEVSIPVITPVISSSTNPCIADQNSKAA